MPDIFKNRTGHSLLNLEKQQMNYSNNTFIRLLLCAAVGLLFFFPVAGQQKEEYARRINLLQKNIDAHFYDAAKGLYYEHYPKKANDKLHSYMWPLCALVQAANEQEAIMQDNDAMEPVVRAIEQYYNTDAPANGYQAYVTAEEHDSRFYDDNQWIAIACLDAYNRTRKDYYLDKPKEIYRFMMTGFDTISGGGLYWKEDEKTTKNTCSNGPGILIALQLYSITGQKNYLDTAMLLYKWVNQHLQSADGLYYDHIKIPSLKIDSAKYTYNTGTMLQANVLLYRITKDQQYLSEAQRIAAAARQYFYRHNKLPGNYWFNAVLLRGLQDLYREDHNRAHIEWFAKDAERIWARKRNADNLVGTQKNYAMIDQAAMIEIYARLLGML
ncbi:glycoside hydrolase family 76 protein [Panacibacter microcysteis]|nr:glycoside hydrolase family 76 protein [Panacibacter microcysteis]